MNGSPPPAKCRRHAFRVRQRREVGGGRKYDECGSASGYPRLIVFQLHCACMRRRKAKRLRRRTARLSSLNDEGRAVFGTEEDESKPYSHPSSILLFTFAYLPAVWVVAGATDLHHVNLGRVLALLAAILAVLGRAAAAGFARALVRILLVSHLVPPSCKRRGRGRLVPQVSSRRAENASERSTED